MPISIWYDWHDDGPDLNEAEHHFGTVDFEYHAGRTPVYTPKPAYLAAKTLTSTMDGFRFTKRIGVGSPDDYAMLFRKDEQLRLAVWTTATEPHRIVLPSDAAVFQVVTHTGQREADARAVDGTLTLTLDDAPRYLIADRPNRALAAAPEAHPLEVSMVPAVDRTLIVRVANAADNKAFRGEARLTHLTGIEATETVALVALDAGDSEVTFRFVLAEKPTASYEAGLLITDAQGRTVLDLPPRRVTPLPTPILADAKLVADGDREVACEYSWTLASAPTPLESLKAPVGKLAYRFGDGWRFLRLAVQRRPEIEGAPSAMGLWIYGDGRGGSPRLRVMDASGQTWQPSGPTIDWTGWRYVEMPLNGSAGRWGGDGNNQLDPPLRWDTIFLLDNPSRRPLEGAV